MEAENGKIARIIAGHDKDLFMVITAVEGNFAYVANGKERKLLAPKKKNIKHLRLTSTVIDMSDLTDKKLRKIIGEYTDKTSVKNP